IYIKSLIGLRRFTTEQRISSLSTQKIVTQHRTLSLHCRILENVHKHYFVYILSSQRRVLYVGVTSNLEERVFQHKMHIFEGFTAQYNVTSLVYFEQYSTPQRAITREKEIKGWRREKKISLIESVNPKWKDLSYGWYQKHRYAPGGRDRPLSDGFSSAL